jgi:hypothetical protein
MAEQERVLCCAVWIHTSATEMKNHTHQQSAPEDNGAFEPMNPERFAAAQKSTWVSIAINLVLTSSSGRSLCAFASAGGRWFALTL